MKVLNILITGATGLVGQKLGQELVRRGHRVFIVSRDRAKAESTLSFPARVIEGDLSHETLRDDELKNIDVAIHLAGESIASGRWTAQRKRRIYDSRVKALQNLLHSLESNSRLQTVVSASAIGFYGDRKDEVLTEDSPRGEGFLSQICQDWEQPLVLAQKQNTWPGLRAVTLRLGVVLSSDGGALDKMRELFRSGLGAAIGSGQQWMSWIHIDDLVSILALSAENASMTGVYNAVSPQPETNADFSKKLAAEFGKKLMPKVPSVLLKTTLGEMSQMLLDSQKVAPEKLIQMGFAFRYPDLESALQQTCASYKNGDLVFKSEQYLPWSVEKVFPFFAEARNLEAITPPTLNFHIESVSTAQMGNGTQITYRLKVHGVPVRWVTEIEKWKPNEEFVDNQLKGPYKKWHHTHHFAPLGKGTLMTDTVLYRLPMGLAGKAVAAAWVRKDIEKIFSYRRQAVLPLLFT